MKRFSFFVGLAVLALIWLGPLLSVYRESFAAHMLAHMGVVAVAAPLLAIGLSDTLSRIETPWASFSTSAPIVASFIELVVVWGWHAPAGRALVVQSDIAAVAEQGSFLLAGLFLWVCCLLPGHEGPGAFGLLLTSVHMTLLGALLALSPRSLYGLDQVTCLGLTLTAAEDQHLGGVIMLLVGAAVYLAGGVVLLGRLLNAPSRAGAR